MRTAERRAVLFDLDGTLVDLGDVHWLALNCALVGHGLEPITKADHDHRYNGLPTKVKLQMRGISEERRPSIEVEKQRETMRLIRDAVNPDPRLIAELERIEAEFFVGIVSNARIETCISVLFKSDIGLHTQLLIAGPYQPGDAKPNPFPYVRAIEAAHLLRERTIAVEDNHYGVEAAELAGLRCLCVSGPHDITYERVSEFANLRMEAA